MKRQESFDSKVVESKDKKEKPSKRIQTAEGWKRAQLKQRKQGIKAK